VIVVVAVVVVVFVVQVVVVVVVVVLSGRDCEWSVGVRAECFVFFCFLFPSTCFCTFPAFFFFPEEILSAAIFCCFCFLSACELLFRLPDQSRGPSAGAKRPAVSTPFCVFVCQRVVSCWSQEAGIKSVLTLLTVRVGLCSFRCSGANSLCL